MTKDEKDRAGQSAQMLYHAARFALAAGLTREEYIATAHFWWGQAGADHGHAIAAEALRLASEPEAK